MDDPLRHPISSPDERQIINAIQCSEDIAFKLRFPRPKNTMTMHERITPRLYPIQNLMPRREEGLEVNALSNYVLVTLHLDIPKPIPASSEIAIIPFLNASHLVAEATDEDKESLARRPLAILDGALTSQKRWNTLFGSNLKHVLAVAVDPNSCTNVKQNQSGLPYQIWRILEFEQTTARLMCTGEATMKKMHNIIQGTMQSRPTHSSPFILFLIKWPSLLPLKQRGSKETMLESEDPTEVTKPSINWTLAQFEERLWAVSEPEQLIPIGPLEGIGRCPYTRLPGQGFTFGESTSGLMSDRCNQPILSHPSIPLEKDLDKAYTKENTQPLVATEESGLPCQSQMPQKKGTSQSDELTKANPDRILSPPSDQPASTLPSSSTKTAPDGPLSSLTSTVSRDDNKKLKAKPSIKDILKATRMGAGGSADVEETIHAPIIIGSQHLSPVCDSILDVIHFVNLRRCILSTSLRYVKGFHCRTHEAEINRESKQSLLDHPLLKLGGLPKASEYLSMEELRAILKERQLMDESKVLELNILDIRSDEKCNKDGEFQKKKAKQAEEWREQMLNAQKRQREKRANKEVSRFKDTEATNANLGINHSHAKRRSISQARSDYYIEQKRHAVVKALQQSSSQEWEHLMALLNEANQALKSGSTSSTDPLISAQRIVRLSSDILLLLDEHSIYRTAENHELIGGAIKQAIIKVKKMVTTGAGSSAQKCFVVLRKRSRELDAHFDDDKAPEKIT